MNPIFRLCLLYNLITLTQQTTQGTANYQKDTIGRACCLSNGLIHRRCVNRHMSNQTKCQEYCSNDPGCKGYVIANSCQLATTSSCPAGWGGPYEKQSIGNLDPNAPMCAIQYNSNVDWNGGCMIKLVKYWKTEAGGKCPTDKVVATEDECKDAASQLVMSFSVITTRTRHPAGCSYLDSKVYFNRRINPSHLSTSFGRVCNKHGSEDPCDGFLGSDSKCNEPKWSGMNVCMIYANTHGGTCNTFCEKQGSKCVKAQKNGWEDRCTRYLEVPEGCDKTWDDQICVCTPKQGKYKKVESKHCADTKYGTYNSVEDAAFACSSDAGCKGVYVPWCYDDVFVHLCPLQAEYHVSEDSCIYEKPGNNISTENPIFITTVEPVTTTKPALANTFNIQLDELKEEVSELREEVSQLKNRVDEMEN